MEKILIDLFWGFIKTLLTQRLFSRIMVRGLWYLSQLTENTVDDGMVEDVAKAAGVEDYK